MVNPLHIDKALLRSYNPIRRVGRGCYGIVWLVRRKEDEQLLAVKRIYNAFQNPQDSQRTYREVLILLNLRGFSGIVTLHDVIQTGDDQELYLVLDSVETDLATTLKNTTLQPVHKQYLTYQIFRALKYVHSANVVYRDMKPTNILLNAHCELKLCDFGFARILGDNEEVEDKLTDYVSSRWYRAPELLLCSRNYRFAIDMWAAGCVIGEIMCARPLFIATSTLHLLDLILAFCGKPNDHDIASLGSPYAAIMLSPFPRSEPANLVPRFPQATADALDLIRLLLQFNPGKRLRADEALRHPYVGNFHNPDDEPILGRKLNLKLPCSEQFLSSTYRDQIYGDVVEIPRARRRLGMSSDKRKA